MKVYVDPACNVNYSSFYIEGLRDVFGKENVSMSSRGFKSLHYTPETHCLAFVIGSTKYVIDFADSNSLFFERFLEWSDVYGKVNYLTACLPDKHKDKIMPIGANFGIAIFGRTKWQAATHCLVNYLKSRKRLKMRFASFLSPYLWLYKRYDIRWVPSNSRVGSRKIFMVSRYWKGQPWVNEARVNFIRACKRLEKEGLIEFVGGMVPDTSDSGCPADVLLEREIPMSDYMRHLDESLLVFNTPSYHHCHGWKLPEYLSQGKIILSTPFVNELPEKMHHGENIYFCESNRDSIYKALKILINNTGLQQRLERGSIEYWQQNASPKSCINKFIYGK